MHVYKPCSENVDSTVLNRSADLSNLLSAQCGSNQKFASPTTIVEIRIMRSMDKFYVNIHLVYLL